MFICNASTEEGTHSNISANSSPAHTSESPLYQSLDTPTAHFQLLASASLPNVKLQTNCSHSVNTSRHHLLPEQSNSYSSSDSVTNSLRRKENRRHHRRPRRSASNISQATAKSQAKLNNAYPCVTPFFPSQWPIALYPMPMGDVPSSLFPQQYASSSIMFPSNPVAVNSMNSFSHSPSLHR